MHGTSNNVTIAGVPAGTYNGISADQINGTYTSISNVTLDSYDLNPSNNTSYSGSIATPTAWRYWWYCCNSNTKQII